MMSTNFRTEVFKLCKKLRKDEASQKIRKMIYDMSVGIESNEIGEKFTDSRNDFAYMSKHSNTEFHGFIFLDENIEKIDIPNFFNVEHLSSAERILIEQGHKTLTRFIDLCLSEIASESNEVADSMNPYFLYKEVSVSENVSTLLSDEELIPAISAFKNGRVYKVLMDANFIKMFKKIDIDAMRGLVSILEKEINQSLGEEISKDIKDFSMKLHTKLDDISDVMFAFSVLMLALKNSLKISCRLLYRAICDIDLFVLNNDNIISIEKDVSTVVSKFYKIFAQEITLNFSGSDMGSILLIDCDLPHGIHIHEFGMLIAQTLNFAGEFGESAKYSVVTVDEELIHIHHLVDEVLKVGLPIINTN